MSLPLLIRFIALFFEPAYRDALAAPALTGFGR
jgi:hypothetical protein